MVKPHAEESGRQFCRMEVVCPQCGGRGLVPWDRLDKFLRCRPCAQWYLIDKSGQLVETGHPATMSVQVRSSFGGWQQETVSLPQPDARGTAAEASANAGERAGFDRSWLLAIAGGVLAGLLAVAFSLRPAPEEQVQAAAPMPSSLEERALVFAQAWLENDLARLLELTEPSHDRDLRRWTSSERPSAEWASVAAESVEIEVLQIKPRNADVAEVDVRIRATGASGGSKEHAQLQHWTKRNGAWFFTPPGRRRR